MKLIYLLLLFTLITCKNVIDGIKLILLDYKEMVNLINHSNLTWKAKLHNVFFIKY